jgi:ankyrin repeat protein
MTACHRGSLKDARALIEAGADVEKGDAENFRPLMCAAVEGRTEIIGLLLQRDARVDATDEYGRTALSWAVTKGDFDGSAKALIESGADVNNTDHGGFTPLMRSALSDNPRCFALLLESGADVTPVNSAWHMTALEMALDRGSETLKAMVRRSGRKSGS